MAHLLHEGEFVQKKRFCYRAEALIIKLSFLTYLSN